MRRGHVRHGAAGKGTMFLTHALRLPVDALVFGKAVACGAFPLAGALVAQEHCVARKMVMPYIRWREHAGRNDGCARRAPLATAARGNFRACRTLPRCATPRSVRRTRGWAGCCGARVARAAVPREICRQRLRYYCAQENVLRTLYSRSARDAAVGCMSPRAEMRAGPPRPRGHRRSGIGAASARRASV